MIRSPTLNDIYAAELLASQCQYSTEAAVKRMKAASRQSVKKFTSWAVIGGIAGVAFIWLSNRYRPVTDSARIATTTSVISLVLAYILRYGKLILPYMLYQNHEQKLPSARPQEVKSFTTDYIQSTTRH
jgi:hypothetical protein